METKIKNLLSRLAFFAEDGMAEPPIVAIAKDADALLKEMCLPKPEKQLLPVARDVLMALAEEVKKACGKAWGSADEGKEYAAIRNCNINAIVDRYAAQPPAVAALAEWSSVPQRVKDSIILLLEDTAQVAQHSDYEAGIKADHELAEACQLLVAMLAAAPQATAEDSSAVLDALAVPIVWLKDNGWKPVPLRDKPPAKQQAEPRCACGDSFTSDAVCANCLAAQQQAEPVAAQCRFEGEEEWSPCTLAHHLLVQAHPKEWPHYETRALCAQPPAVACNHRIADARNPVVSSGYVCVDCGALFSAADHNEPPAVAVPDERAAFEQEWTIVTASDDGTPGPIPQRSLVDPDRYRSGSVHSAWKWWQRRAMLAAAPQAVPLSAALSDIAAERRRQIESEGWTPEHDDAHSDGQMATAAACYAISAHNVIRYKRITMPSWWPWDSKWWKPGTTRRDLVKAGALIAAEIERLDRAAQKGGEA